MLYGILNNIASESDLKPQNEQFINVSEKTSFVLFIVGLSVIALLFLVCILRFIFYKKTWWFCDLISKLKL